MTMNAHLKEGADLAKLIPETTIVIGGSDITVREYNFAQGLRLTPLVMPIVDAIVAIAAAGDIPDPEALRPTFAENAENVHRLIAESCGKDADWVANLPDADGHALQLAWWTVNSDFFGRRVVQGVVSRNLRQSIGDASTSH